MQQVNRCGQRMKRSGGLAPAEARLDPAQDGFHVVRHLPLRMTAGVVARVPTVIALIKDEDLELAQEASPEWKIRIDRKPVAMRQDQPRPSDVSMPTHAHDRAVGHGQIENGDRLRKMKFHRRNIFRDYSAARGMLYH